MSSVRIVENPAGIAQMLQDADLREYGENVADAAKANAPVLSGDYRDSIHVEDAPDGLGVVIVSDIEYAMSIEANDGTLARALDSA
jgi:hypothetical protein